MRRSLQDNQRIRLLSDPLHKLRMSSFSIQKLLMLTVCQTMSIKCIFRNVDTNGIVHVSFPPCLVIRAQSPSIRSGHQKRRGRPYSSTVHNDQEGNDPTLAVARHKCRAGRRLLYRTRATLWIKQEGNPKKGNAVLREPKAMRFRFIEEHRDAFSTERMCAGLDVSTRTSAHGRQHTGAACLLQPSS